MTIEISKEAISFVSHFKPQELRDVRVYLDTTDCQAQGGLTRLDLAILDSIKKKSGDIRIQILARIDEVLAGDRAA